MSSDRLTSHIRFTPALKKRLKVAAAENGRSLNEEVVLRLECSFDLTDSQRERLKHLSAEIAAILAGKAD